MDTYASPPQRHPADAALGDLAALATELRERLADPAENVCAVAQISALEACVERASQAIVRDARDRGLPWSEIRDMLGVHSQDAHQQFTHSA